jgi:aspartyl-tRNA(Asn)/glutamyl-tRNA(Gln) amidotransferase subunit B
MRRKETSADYRYFPEPDLVELEIDERWMAEIRRSIPELPVPRRLRFREKLGLGDYDAGVLTDEREFADFFEECVAAGGASAKTVANLFTNAVLRRRNEGLNLQGIRKMCPASYIAEIASEVDKGNLSIAAALKLFEWTTTTTGPAVAVVTTTGPATIVTTTQLRERIEAEAQISDESVITAVVDKVLAANAKSVADYKAGKKAAFNALIGPVMRETKGKANPQMVRQILEKRLGEH